MKKTKKTINKAILKGISLQIPEGTMTAIIGPSGSGKTTLMNFLSGRQDNSQSFENYCQYYLNNVRIKNIDEFKNIIGYVTQDDIMDIRFTPREIFEYYAKLRGTASPEKTAQEIIECLNLQRCANTIIGDNIKIRGISGGEKKRVNIGIELVSNPNLLFLDEPTTGLDSSTAFEVIDHMDNLKRNGITIITTIHSPSPEILEKFDNLIILCDGFLVFEGKPKYISKRLEHLGF